MNSGRAPNPALLFMHHGEQGPAEAVGVKLRQLRTDAKLTGLQLAALTGIHNSRLSRIERGVEPPRVEEVTVILDVLTVSDDLRAAIIETTTSLASPPPGWSGGWVAPSGLQRVQGSVTEWTASIEDVLWFEPLSVPGPLQTPEYARGVFLSDLSWLVGDSPEQDFEEALQERLRQQLYLFDMKRRFTFLLLESSFTYAVVDREVMAGQVHRVLAAAAQSNIEIAVIPAGSIVPAPMMSNFRITNGTVAQVEPPMGIVHSTSGLLIERLTRLFWLLHDVSLRGDDARAFLYDLAEKLGQSSIDLRGTTELSSS